MEENEPWSAKDATDGLRRIARDTRFSLAYKVHAMNWSAERGIIVSDVLYILKHGFVYLDAVPALQQGRFKYEIESRSPNSGGRKVRLVVMPEVENCTIKLVTIMWVDEDETRAGTLTEESK